jgi:hypothetical protein
MTQPHSPPFSVFPFNSPILLHLRSSLLTRQSTTMLISSTSLITLLASCSLASATFSHGKKFSWGCDQKQKDHAPQPVRNDCSGKGSFFTSFGGKAVCCSDKTRVPYVSVFIPHVSEADFTSPPKHDSCPRTWSWHNRQGCCIPPKEICERDCGEGYVFNKNLMKCEKNQVNKCGQGKW